MVSKLFQHAGYLLRAKTVANTRKHNKPIWFVLISKEVRKMFAEGRIDTGTYPGGQQFLKQVIVAINTFLLRAH
jgi:hypothetical protein